MNPQIPNRYRMLLSFALALSAGAWLPATAGDPPASVGPAIAVKYTDLDLDSEKGRRELLDRLSQAARRVCREYAGSYVAEYQYVYEGCYRATLAAAVQDVHHERVTELYASVGHAPGVR